MNSILDSDDEVYTVMMTVYTPKGNAANMMLSGATAKELGGKMERGFAYAVVIADLIGYIRKTNPESLRHPSDK